MKKYKKEIIHGIVWGIFILLLNTETLDLEWSAFDRKNGSLIVPLLYGTGIGAMIFYLNINYFIPKYFGQRSKMQFWLWSAAAILGLSLLETLLDVVFLKSQGFELAQVQLDEKPVSSVFGWYLMVFLSAVVPNVLCWILAFAFRLPKDWLLAEKQKNQLEKDRLRSELDFLRAQINPHFLFNGINSIYHLIGVDNVAAKDTLLQFSGLLRYQLYDCGVNYISLEKELNYIKNYIHIEEVRKGEDATFDFNLPDITKNQHIKNFSIAPLLISPFLENAFKYLSHYSNREKNYINLDLAIDEKGFLMMELTNSFEHIFESKKESNGGIGLKNVRRRLKILYPEEKHHLKVSHSEHQFSVNLKLDLNED